MGARFAPSEWEFTDTQGKRGQKSSRGNGIVGTSYKVTCSLPYIQMSHAEVLTVVCVHVGTEAGVQTRGPVEAAPWRPRPRFLIIPHARSRARRGKGGSDYRPGGGNV